MALIKRIEEVLFLKKKSKLEKIEDIEILRFFELDTKIKMIRLNSNSIAVDEISDVAKAEKLIRQKINNLK